MQQYRMFDQTLVPLSKLDRLVTAMLNGVSVLVTGPGGGNALLDSAAAMLAGLRTRVLRPRSQDELLALMHQGEPPNPVAGTTGMEAGFRALTVLDPACDRIALLVGDAHLLSPAALTCVELAVTTIPHLHVGLAGPPALADEIASGQFARLRRRLSLHIVTDEDEQWSETAPPPGRRDGLGKPGHDAGATDRRAAFTPPDWYSVLKPAPDSRRRSRLAWLLAGLVGLTGAGAAAVQLAASPGVNLRSPPAQPEPATAETPPTEPAPVVAAEPPPAVVPTPANPAPAQAATSAPEPPPVPVAGENAPAAWAPAMATVSGGILRMGGGDNASERPVHSVFVKSFMLATHATTVGEWQRCVDAKVCAPVPDGGPEQQVAHASWDDARQFADWLASATGQRYRLPTEAEWEYAARSGNAAGDGADTPTAGANAFGFGFGAAEWVADCWHRDYRGAPHDASKPWESGSCRNRVLRGASGQDRAGNARLSARESFAAAARAPGHGFRVAWSEP